MRFVKRLFPQNLKNIYHLVQAILANVVYGFPSKKIKVVGITGSDGKTTTTQMVAKIFEEAGKKVAMASTINFVINGQEEKNLSHYTTESAFAVQKFIRKAVSQGCEYLVLETSSHALDQHRVWGVKFQTALITNVTREHLDYHKTMEKYRKAKEKLFEIVEKNSRVTGHQSSAIVVNADMEKPEDFLRFNVDKKFVYSTKGSKLSMTDDRLQYVWAENVELGISGSSYEIQKIKYEIHIPGDFNIENALGATCVGLSEGIGLETIKEALAKIKGIPGRLESVGNDRGLNIIVDFALTPNALEKLYKLLSAVKKNNSKIIAVFGSCGERDRGKRPIMGKIVSKYADHIILTNDEPYHEDPERIVDEIFAGVMNSSKNKIDESDNDPNFQFPISNFQSSSNDQISKNKTHRIEGVNCFRILDRRMAIRKALELANNGDIIAVTGMGNFETMVVGDKKIPWNDRKVIEEELMNRS